ncbi:hypothetical protein ACFRMQ_06740 [Kitasatospora sp. NPDC056783]|uniref:hypothetical protein n=1 Tax=Kitasatospora sp. NPDC056783 TaxID=3345943 RepID=UPI0036B1D3F1
MSSEIQRSQDDGPGSSAAVPVPRAGRRTALDGRGLDLVALMSILAVCALICLTAGAGALQAVIGAAGVLFAAWRTPRRSGREEERRPGPRG